MGSDAVMDNLEAWQSEIASPKNFGPIFELAANQPKCVSGFEMARMGAMIEAAFRVESSIQTNHNREWKIAKSNQEGAFVLQSPDITLIQFKSLVVGKAVYPFQTDCCIAIAHKNADIELPHSQFMSSVDLPTMNLDVVGWGCDINEAIDSYARTLHQRVQYLLGKSVLEMSSEERSEWEAVSEAIDIPEHKRLSPIELPRIGTVTSVRPFQVKWLSDDESTDIDLSKAPSRLASFEVGDEFEAIVEFNRGTQEFGSILYVGPIANDEEPISDDFEEQDTEPPLTLIDF